MALADVNSSDEGYKSNRPSQILKSEKFVENIMNVMTEEYINPFDESLEKDCLYNLSSGIQVELGIANEISQNGENKGRMIEIIKDEMDKPKHAFLEKLKCNEIMFSVNKVCIRMTEHSTDVVDEAKQ
ncbi:hypothetical protein GQR58_027624 [Nymphon striatum]|nr:hypothetical protein GQR58_027624 [Nymphon striatum]